MAEAIPNIAAIRAMAKRDIRHGFLGSMIDTDQLLALCDAAEQKLPESADRTKLGPLSADVAHGQGCRAGEPPTLAEQKPAGDIGELVERLRSTRGVNNETLEARYAMDDAAIAITAQQAEIAELKRKLEEAGLS